MQEGRHEGVLPDSSDDSGANGLPLDGKVDSKRKKPKLRPAKQRRKAQAKEIYPKFLGTVTNIYVAVSRKHGATPCGYGIRIFHKGELAYENYGIVSTKTTNYSSYWQAAELAIAHAAEFRKYHQLFKVNIWFDSPYVVHSLSNIIRIRKNVRKFRKYKDRITRFVDQLDFVVKWNYIKRKANFEAVRLAREGYELAKIHYAIISDQRELAHDEDRLNDARAPYKRFPKDMQIRWYPNMDKLDEKIPENFKRKAKRI